MNTTYTSTTIVAQATPRGQSAVAIVRLSGNIAFEIALKITKKISFKNNRSLVSLFDLNNKSFEQALILTFRAPNSFTGEDIVEFHCHGNQLIAQKLIECCLEYGATLAGPGEFSQRAFLNGKLNLIQAEAIMDLIGAKSEVLLKASSSQLLGSLTKNIIGIKEKILEAIGLIHGPLDFPVESEFAEINLEQIKKLVLTSKDELSRLFTNARSMSVLRQGLKTVILGRPNVGKSSLLNLLLQTERAIVSSEPGTTRDFLAEEILIRDIPIMLIDTAGLRSETENKIEKAGIEKSKQLSREADFVIFVFDASVGWTNEDQNLFEIIKQENTSSKIVTLANKQDVLTPDELKNIANLAIKPIMLSTKTAFGITSLEDEIERIVFNEKSDSQNNFTSAALEGDFDVAINQRQAVFIKNALKTLENINFSEGVEVISLLLEDALQELNEISGEGKFQSDQAMQSVFSNFCIGK